MPNVQNDTPNRVLGIAPNAIATPGVRKLIDSGLDPLDLFDALSTHLAVSVSPDDAAEEVRHRALYRQVIFALSQDDFDEAEYKKYWKLATKADFMPTLSLLVQKDTLYAEASPEVRMQEAFFDQKVNLLALYAQKYPSVFLALSKDPIHMPRISLVMAVMSNQPVAALYMSQAFCSTPGGEEFLSEAIKIVRQNVHNLPTLAPGILSYKDTPDNTDAVDGLCALIESQYLQGVIYKNAQDVPVRSGSTRSI